MAEAAAQPLLESQTSEERLDEDEARERGQLAVFKTQCGQAMGFAVDFGFAILSLRAISLAAVMIVENILYREVQTAS